MQVIEKVKGFGRKAADKAVMAACSAAVAANALAVTAFASGTGGGTSTDMSSITSVLQEGFTSMVSNVISVATAVVPIGLGVFGLGFIVSKAKQLFSKVT